MEYLKRYWPIFAIVFIMLVYIKPAVALLVLGPAFCYWSIRGIRTQRKIRNNGIECIGRILSFEADNDGLKVPVVEFTLTRGRVVSGKPHIYSFTDLRKVWPYDSLIGSEVLVIYDPDEPKKFVITSRKNHIIFFYVLFFAISLFLTVMGVASLLVYIKVHTDL